MENDLVKDWIDSGINEGDVVLVHSSLKRTLIKHKTTPEKVLKTLIKAVGDEGTLLLPTFNFEFPKKKLFDINKTPSQMGVLTEKARYYKGSIRSGHPIYSFAIIGKHAEKFKVDNNSGYGSDSPFAILRELNGKIAVLDLEDQKSMTFYHHIEEMNGIDYRYFKEFEGIYIDDDGNSSNRSYKLFVRNLKLGILTDVNAMGEILWDKGLYEGYRPQIETGMRTINSNKMFEEVTKVIKSGKANGLLYSIDPALE